METTDRTLVTTQGRLRVRSCDAQTATDADVAALVALSRQRYLEQWVTTEAPGDDLIEQRIRHGLGVPGRMLWAVFTPAQGTAVVYTGMNQAGGTRTTASVYVLPEFRCLGIGTALLEVISQRLRGTECTSVETETTTREPAGQAFADRLSGTPLTEACVQQLMVTDVDMSALGSWLKSEHELGFQLRTSQGRYDESDLRSIAPLKTAVRAQFGRIVMDQRPEQMIDQLLQEERHLDTRREERWAVCARATPAGAVVGYNEAMLGAELPALLEETETSVAESMRGRGLGRLLKARLLKDVLDSRPAIRQIRTTNLTRATGMLKTNQLMGYRVNHYYTRWEIPAEKLHEYLSTLE